MAHLVPQQPRVAVIKFWASVKNVGESITQIAKRKGTPAVSLAKQKPKKTLRKVRKVFQILTQTIILMQQQLLLACITFLVSAIRL